jgi:MoaA/NifB/PqqE/SkfB family radical SAM enzyme
MKIIESPTAKFMFSEDCSFAFNKLTGYTETWGKTIHDDPLYSPYGMIIADIEISTICGTRGKLCPFCYKGATTKGESMSLETFKKLFSKLPKTLTQIAFGTGEIDSNPDTFEIFQYTRDQGVIPNVTINGRITKEEAEKLAKVCGAVAISNYNKNDCYGSVELLSSMGLKQVNIHQLASEETFSQCLELLQDTKTDERLKSVNAIVFLSLKKKGRGEGYHPLSFDKKVQLYKAIQEAKCGYGFDSCGSHQFLKYLEMTNQKELEQYVEPCESGLFSFYINVEGKGFPCSFTEEGEGIDLLTIDDFLSEVWFNPEIVAWRNNLLACGRACPVYNV